MAITRVKPKVAEKAVSDFIAGAPDHSAAAASSGAAAPGATNLPNPVGEGTAPAPVRPQEVPQDLRSKQKGVRKGNKLQISLTISPSLLDKVDAMAASLGQSRAALITMALHQALERGVTLSASRQAHEQAPQTPQVQQAQDDLS